MRTLAFDGRMGASGDMLLSALLSAGADRDALAPVEAAIPVRYEVGTVEKNGISATTVDVVLTDEGESGEDSHSHGDHDEDDHDHEGNHAHEGDDQGHGDDEDDHSHENDHTHRDDDHSHEDDDHNHDHDHSHAEGHGPHRTYAEVIEIVEGMDLPEGVETEAKAIFTILGEAEASVHGTDLADTHFHEVGADDAIADIVGVCLLLEDLGIEAVVTTPLAAGGGEVEMGHGTYPVPTPAVVEIAQRADWSLRGGPVEAELLTPTGAAILAHLASGVESLPTMTVGASGYGAGGYDFPEHPNVLRALVGETAGSLRKDPITVLETNLDDASPELLGGLQESLAEVGALDVSIVPVTMKKSRPGHIVTVICKPEDAQRVARRLAEETGTLGVRETGVDHRWIADRAVETVSLEIGGDTYEVDVKIASDSDGEVYDISAEFEDAAAVAAATDLPTRAVMRRAEDVLRS